MKISLRDLRKLVRETLDDLASNDDRFAPGDIVSVIIDGKSEKGVIQGALFPGQHDPMSTRHAKSNLHKTMWTVKVHGRLFQVAPENIRMIKGIKQPDISQEKHSWKTDVAPRPVTSEAIATMGRSTMLHGSDDFDTDDEILSDEEDLAEADEKAEANNFDDQKYDIVARQLVLSWENTNPSVSWNAVAKTYADTQRSLSGKQIDVKKLYSAIMSYLETDGDKRNQNVFAGTHLYK